ncbi:hypothetical protein DFH06DRAFT_1422696 [Mycena polygramma]|nr:hypothetical protein DFH06DRAFT_1422696 [Mycena polygramma]
MESQTTDSTTSEPRAKRQRTDSAEDVTRSDIWQDDGNVVLQAESTQFRVHWSVLSKNSAFFQEMRTLPQPPDQPTVEGCPVVTLHDSVLDVQYLLEALYNPHCFAADRLSFPFIAALVRLGRKYDFKHLLEAAVKRLAYENPTTLEKYEHLTKIVDSRSSYSATRIMARGGLLFDTITLARENNLFALLPCAYLRALFFFSLEEIFDGIPSPVGPSVTLSPEDQRICILGSKKMLQAQWGNSRFAAWMGSQTPLTGCSQRLECLRKKETVFRDLIANGTSFAPFQLIAEYLCDTCHNHQQEVLAEAREKLWEDLPTFFNLRPWAELKNEL